MIRFIYLLLIVLPYVSAISQEYSEISFEDIFSIEDQVAIGASKLSDSEKDALRIIVIEFYISGKEKGYSDGFSKAVSSKSSIEEGDGVIESKVDGDFEGFEGETIIKLMNGQIWQQSEYSYHYHYAFMPDVTIYPSGNGFKMKVEGVNRAVRVVKIR